MRSGHVSKKERVAAKRDFLLEELRVLVRQTMHESAAVVVRWPTDDEVGRVLMAARDMVDEERSNESLGPRKAGL